MDKKLTQLGYSDSELPALVQLNLEFARANMKSCIYDQAILEGISTTFSQTEAVIDNGKINGMSASDVQKILNLKHAWEFILDKDVISYPTDFSILCHIARLVNEGFYYDGGRIRGAPVSIGGTSYVPLLPIGSVIKEQLAAILSNSLPVDEKAVALCLFCMKSQIFNDGNKRAAVIFTNHFLISQGAGLLVVPAHFVPEFRKRLIAYYEDKDTGETVAFMKKSCIKTF